MKLVVFGLTVSSSWGNGHATLWRGLIRALGRRGWRTTFFERDVPYYAKTRDLFALEAGELRLYDDWETIRPAARHAVAEADVAMVTSYCPDGVAASELVLDVARGLRAFYDLDTPVTLARLGAGEPVDYVGEGGLVGFDLVLSYTGGAALDELARRLGARRTAPLYGHVDPELHRPGEPEAAFAGDLSHIGTYAEDRRAAIEELLVAPARLSPDRRFVIAGTQYPTDFPWTRNIHFVRHLPPADHPRFFASSRATLNITRAAMAELGWCPSGRLFEAAACGAAILTDTWPGLADFFEPGREILPVRSAGEVLAAMALPDEEFRRIGKRARERILAEHTSDRRAAELEALLASPPEPRPALIEEA